MIEDKLLRGYAFRNKSMKTASEERSVNIITGVGGAKMMIDAYRKADFSDELIETLIEVQTDEYGWRPLSDIIIKNIKDDTNTIK